MFLKKLEFESTTVETLPPDDDKSAEIYSRIGYKLEEALADLVDNSIDAEAKNILIRFVRYSEGIHSVVIADDGKGMSDAKLHEAMRFGSRTNKGPTALGKYGIGLKSASLSQAQTVVVISKANGSSVGRRWTKENIKKGWKCEVLEKAGCELLLSSGFGPVELRKSGTVVIWERLEHLRAAPANIDKVLEKHRKTVSVELGIKFHRLLNKNVCQIYTDTLELTEDSPSFYEPILSLDPFEYDQPGHPQYPKGMELILPNHRKLTLRCHIWPPKTKANGYRLGGGKVASRQGFYFYRNDRLIQAGGWNGLQADDSEPHMSLARVEIDLPSNLESLFKLNIGKSLIDPPAQFQVLVEAADTDGFTFRKYLRDADSAYRRQKKKESSKFPYIPGTGFPRNMRPKVKTAFAEIGVAKPQEINFKWEQLEPGEVFRLDTDIATVVLNKRYRIEIAGGSNNDGSIVKLLLLLLVQDNFGKSFLTERSKDWLRRVNNSMLISMSASS